VKHGLIVPYDEIMAMFNDGQLIMVNEGWLFPIELATIPRTRWRPESRMIPATIVGSEMMELNGTRPRRAMLSLVVMLNDGRFMRLQCIKGTSWDPIEESSDAGFVPIAPPGTKLKPRTYWRSKGRCKT
jgi:hypothetical protein